MARRRWVVVAILGLATAAICGCDAGDAGRNAAHLQGIVTIAGQRIPTDAQASVTFSPTVEGQGRSTTAQIVDSKYDCPDAPRGNVKVFISVQQPTGKMVREGRGSAYPEVRSLIAARYGDGIDLGVEGDNSAQDFDLEPM